MVRKEPIEDKKKDLCSGIGSGSGMGTEDSSRITSSPASPLNESPSHKTSVYRQRNASKVENIHPNGRDCFSNRHDSERRLEYPEKTSGMRKSWKNSRKNLESATSEKYLEKNMEYRKLEKFSNSEKINSREKVPYTVYREHL